MSNCNNLIKFIENRDIKKIENLIKNGIDINSCNKDEIPLIEAVRKNSIEIVELLVLNGADINAFSDDDNGMIAFNYMTALMYASRFDYVNIAEFLIENGAEIDLTNYRGASALIHAVFGNSLNTIKLLIDKASDKGMDIINSGDGMYPALNAASGNNPRIDVAKYLIENGANIDAKCIQGFTALISASMYDNIDISKLLINNGADMEAKGMFGWTALMWASIEKRKNLAKLLIDNDVDIEAKDHDGRTALMLASQYNSYTIIDLLIDSGADIEAKDHDGRTALMLASIQNNLSVANFLISKGAEIKNVSLDLVCTYEHKEMIELLIDNNLPVNNEALNKSILLGYKDIVETLLKEDIDLKKEDEYGFKAMDYADYYYNNNNDDNSLIDILIRNGVRKEKELTEDDKKKIDSIKKELISSLDNSEEIAKKTRLLTLYDDKHNKQTIKSYTRKYSGTTFLIEAIKLEYKDPKMKLDLIEKLVSMNEDIDAKDKEGKSVYVHASESKDSDTIIDILDRQDELIKESYNPIQQLAELLSNFTNNPPIKFTTHSWDSSYYGGLDGFMQEVRTQFDEISEDLKELSPNLHKKIEAFLLQSEIEESWRKKEDLKIGWKTIDGLKEWCDEGKNPFDFKFKSTLLIEGEKIRLFSDVIELFKKEIEIRTHSKHLESIFLKQQKRLGKEFEVELINLDGKGFYTDVEKFENSIKRIFDPIKMRKEHKKITVMVEEPTDDTIEIIITQHDSTSNKKSYELLRAVDGGDFKILKDNLTNLCYWSIEDSYEGEGFVVDVFNQEIKTIPDIPSGFTHKLRFYKK